MPRKTRDNRPISGPFSQKTQRAKLELCKKEAEDADGGSQNLREGHLTVYNRGP
jgi:hypothetical protein